MLGATSALNQGTPLGLESRTGLLPLNYEVARKPMREHDQQLLIFARDHWAHNEGAAPAGYWTMIPATR